MGHYCEKSVLDRTTDNKEILKIIFDNALKHRPKTDIEYRPLTHFPYTDENFYTADLKKLYPEYKTGDYVFFEGYMDGLYEKDMNIHLKKCSDKPRLYFNGEEIPTIKSENKEDCYDCFVTFKKGENHLIVKIAAQGGDFGVEIAPQVPELGNLPNYYVYNSWIYIKEDGFDGQRVLRISKLYKQDQKEPLPDEIEWSYPKKPLQSNEKVFDFNKLCKKGKAAYSYTEIKGKLAITHNSPIKIYVNQTIIYSGERGTFAEEFEDYTPIFIESRNNGEWGFTALTDGAHRLSFVKGADCPDLQWLWVGPFGKAEDGETVNYAPTYNLQFDEAYTGVNGPKFWKFYREDTDLKITLHSYFYGQWFYPLMVGLHGMKLAAEKLGLEDFNDYFASWMELLCKHRDYGKYEFDSLHSENYLIIGGWLKRLDPIGTAGTNIADYYMMTGNFRAKYLLQLLCDSMMYEVPRFPDGTFNRISTMWTDDTYMCLPFLARMAVLTGDKKYYDDILTQARGFYERLWMEDQGLFSHVYFIDENTPNHIPWGRGNGWVLLALSEVLLLIPEDYEGRGEILDIFARFSEGVLKHRDKDKGIWHQVVNNPDTYIEASGSAMFITALARGVRKGWIEASAKDDVHNAYKALLHHCVDENGDLYGVCKGSGCNMDEKYYAGVETIVNDDHGVGIVMETCVEVMNMLGE